MNPVIPPPTSDSPPSADPYAVLRQAYLEIQRLRGRVAELENAARGEAIAVVGVGCRFPGDVGTPEEYWALLLDGVDATGDMPPDRWDVERFYDPHPLTPGKMYTRRGGFVRDVDQFDAAFFGIAPREAASMDPQQRFVLEVAWEALENAALAPSRLAGSRTGVFVGISTSDFGARRVHAAQVDAHSATGTAFGVAAGRLSYVLGLQGPCVALDTACSSSLTAVHFAVQSLRRRECDLALAGGVNLMLSPEMYVSCCLARMLAVDGRCKTFDASADGFGRGEGCGIVVLKRLADALASRDRVLALIRGSALNHQGRSAGLTAPNGIAQERLLRDALADAGLKPEAVGYVEAHGTGTLFGDMIELRALATVFAVGRSPEMPLVIGSAKTNLGHLEAAAGVAGLIKVVLALQHREIPPHLHMGTPNPHFDWDRWPLRVPGQRQPWLSGPDGRRRAGVSSFGFGGTNVHVILEESPSPSLIPSLPVPSLHLLCLSARSEVALRQLAGRFERHLAREGDDSLADVCFSALVGRSAFAYRLAVTAATRDEMRSRLASFAAGRAEDSWKSGYHATGAEPPAVPFLFPGPEAWPSAAGRHLFETRPAFRAAVHTCAQYARPFLTCPLEDALFRDGRAEGALALFTLQYALAQLWRSWGIEPAAVIGGGAGEYAAACVAGVFGPAAALRLAAGVREDIRFTPPQVPFLSAASGDVEVPQRPGYWAKVRPPGRLAEAAARAHPMSSDMAVEISPFPGIHQSVGPLTCFASLNRGQDDWHTLLDTLGTLYIRGAAVRGEGFDDGHRRRLALPTYPFQRERFWFEEAGPGSGVDRTGDGQVLHPPVTPTLADGLAAEGATPASVLLERFRAGPLEEAMGLLREEIRSAVARVLGAAADPSFDAHTPFRDLGLAFGMSRDLMNQLSRRLGRLLSPTLPFNYPTIEALTGHLAATLRPGPSEEADGTADSNAAHRDPEPSERLEERLAAIEAFLAD